MLTGSMPVNFTVPSRLQPATRFPRARLSICGRLYESQGRYHRGPGRQAALLLPHSFFPPCLPHGRSWAVNEEWHKLLGVIEYSNYYNRFDRNSRRAKYYGVPLGVLFKAHARIEPRHTSPLPLPLSCHPARAHMSCQTKVTRTMATTRGSGSCDYHKVYGPQASQMKSKRSPDSSTSELPPLTDTESDTLIETEDEMEDDPDFRPEGLDQAWNYSFEVRHSVAQAAL